MPLAPDSCPLPLIHAPCPCLQAIARMLRALDETVFVGVPTTIPFHKLLLRNEQFVAGNIDTAFIVKNAADLAVKPPTSKVRCSQIHAAAPAPRPPSSALRSCPCLCPIPHPSSVQCPTLHPLRLDTVHQLIPPAGSWCPLHALHRPSLPPPPSCVPC